MAQDALKTAAAAFDSSGLWLTYPEDAMFAVQYPGGEIAYCCVMGDGNVMPTLLVYPGDEGLAAYYRLRTLPQDAPAFRVHEVMVRQECLQYTAPAGAGEEPAFRKRSPYYPAVATLSETDEARLCYALAAASVLSMRLDTMASSMRIEEALAASGLHDETQTIPLLTAQADVDIPFAFGEIQLPEDARISADSPSLTEDVAEALSRLPINEGQILQCELTIGPNPVGTPPAYPVGLSMYDPDQGIVGMPVVENYPEDYTELVAALLSFFMEHGRPSQVQTQDDTTYLLLKNSLEQIGIPLSPYDSLPELTRLKAEFHDGIPSE